MIICCTRNEIVSAPEEFWEGKRNVNLYLWKELGKSSHTLSVLAQGQAEGLLEVIGAAWGLARAQEHKQQRLLAQ